MTLPHHYRPRERYKDPPPVFHQGPPRPAKTYGEEKASMPCLSDTALDRFVEGVFFASDGPWTRSKGSGGGKGIA
jgi:hypothetical protein